MDPQRTCIGCRLTQAKAGLVRLAWQEGVGVVVDREQRLGGRGCYVHRACVADALRKRAIGRALQRVVDPVQVADAVSALVRAD